MKQSKSDSTSPNPERTLLEEGAKSYAPAVGAVLAFRELVQARCRQVIRKRLREYSAALGVNLDQKQIRDHVGPRAGEWTGDWASVGVELREIGKPSAWLYHSLDWMLEDGTWTTWVNASIWLKRSSSADRLEKLFHPHPPDLTFWQEYKDVGFSANVLPAEIATFEEKLDEVYVSWIRLWQRLGGLKALSAAAN